jgi:hypothetical protein
LIPDVEIRTFMSEDLDQVIAIEEASFPDPYSKPFFWFLKLKAGNGFIVAMKERTVGYAISEIRRGRGHIISMAVYGAVQLVVIGASAILMKTGASAISPSVDWTGIAGHLLIWDPLWLLGGILFLVISQPTQTRVMRRFAKWFRAPAVIVSGRIGRPV